MHRVTARVLPVNATGEVLLLHGWDPALPEAPFWFSVGGAGEPGESLAEAAARELFEETGIRVASADLGEPIYLEVGAEFDWGEFHLVQDQHYFAVAVAGDVVVDFGGLEPLEVGTIDAAAWWTADALEADGRASNEVLPEAMRSAVAAVGAR